MHFYLCANAEHKNCGVTQQESVDELAEELGDGTVDQPPPVGNHGDVAGDVDPEALANITRTVQVEMAQQVTNDTACSRCGCANLMSLCGLHSLPTNFRARLGPLLAGLVGTHR